MAVRDGGCPRTRFESRGIKPRMKDTTTITREELYELVWTTPMSRLATEYSISDVGLKKLCARHNIPTPPRGYWARRNAGQKVARAKLPASKDGAPIQLPVATLDEHGAEVQDALAQSIAEAKRPENRITVADRLRSPTELVRNAKSLLEDAAPDELGLLERPSACLDVRVSRAQLPRALRIADALMRAFERRGWDVTVKPDGTIVLVDEVPIAVTIEEDIETFELPPKPELNSSYSFHYDRRETGRRPSGSLTVSIREPHHLWNHSQQRNWRGSDKRALEDRLTDVIVGVLKLSSAVKADVARREREALEEQQRRRKVQLALDEQKRLRSALAQEKARVELLVDRAARWHESRSARLFIEEARKRGTVDELRLEGNDFVRWLAWATEQADRLDPFTPSPPSILDEAERIEHMCDGFRGWR